MPTPIHLRRTNDAPDRALEIVRGMSVTGLTLDDARGLLLQLPGAIAAVEDHGERPEVGTSYAESEAAALLETRDIKHRALVKLEAKHAALEPAARDMSILLRMYHDGDACESPANCGNCRALKRYAEATVPAPPDCVGSFPWDAEDAPEGDGMHDEAQQPIGQHAQWEGGEPDTLEGLAAARGRVIPCGEVLHDDYGRPAWLCQEPRGTEHSHHDVVPACAHIALTPDPDDHDRRLAAAKEA